jgi:hypothetical protein
MIAPLEEPNSNGQIPKTELALVHGIGVWFLVFGSFISDVSRHLNPRKNRCQALGSLLAAKIVDADENLPSICLVEAMYEASYVALNSRRIRLMRSG